MLLRRSPDGPPTTPAAPGSTGGTGGTGGTEMPLSGQPDGADPRDAASRQSDGGRTARTSTVRRAADTRRRPVDDQHVDSTRDLGATDATDATRDSGVTGLTGATDAIRDFGATGLTSATGAPGATRASGPALVRLRAVDAHHDGHAALSGIDLDLAPGRHTVLVGPNGSGKSTLLAVLAGTHDDVRGRVERVAGLRIGLVVQRSAVTGRLPLTVRETVALGRWGRTPRGVSAPSAVSPGGVRPGGVGPGGLGAPGGVRPDGAGAPGGLEMPPLGRPDGADPHDAASRRADRGETARTGTSWRPADARRRRAEDRRAVDAALEALDIADLASRSLAGLSGGQRQRALVAQGLARQADLLLLDEPTAGVDAAAERLIRAAVAAEVARGATVVEATHDADLRGEQVDVVHLVDGRRVL